MGLQIIHAKVQTVFLNGKDKGNGAESERRFKVTIGTYTEFDDGCTIKGPDGRCHRGRGTVVRFNYRHGTWSVQRPQRCETNRVGYVFTPQGEPCWLKDERESGFTQAEFERNFSAAFVELCLAAQARAKPVRAPMSARAA